MSEILLKVFLSKYREIKNIFLSNIGEFVYLRIYLRYFNNKKRRENWFEIVFRIIEYNI